MTDRQITHFFGDACRPDGHRDEMTDTERAAAAAYGAVEQTIRQMEHAWKDTTQDEHGIHWARCTCGWKSLGYTYAGGAFNAFLKRHQERQR